MFRRNTTVYTRRAAGALGAFVITLSVVACSGASPSGGGQTPLATPPPSTDLPTQPSQAPTGADNDAAGSPGATGVAACSLLSDDDVMAATGHRVVGRQPGPTFGIFENGCVVDLDDEGSPSNLDIQIGIIQPGGQRYYDTYFKPFAAENGQEPVPGVGDEALSETADGILVKTGDAFLSVQYVTEPRSDLAVTRKLVEAALSKLR